MLSAAAPCPPPTCDRPAGVTVELHREPVDLGEVVSGLTSGRASGPKRLLVIYRPER